MYLKVESGSTNIMHLHCVHQVGTQIMVSFKEDSKNLRVFRYYLAGEEALCGYVTGKIIEFMKAGIDGILDISSLEMNYDQLKGRITPIDRSSNDMPLHQPWFDLG